MCNSVEIPQQLWEFHTSFGNLTSVMWVSKKPQCECGPFSMSSYNSTQWVWNPLFPHHCRGNSTDLRLVGQTMSRTPEIRLYILSAVRRSNIGIARMWRLNISLLRWMRLSKYECP